MSEDYSHSRMIHLRHFSRQLKKDMQESNDDSLVKSPLKVYPLGLVRPKSSLKLRHLTEYRLLRDAFLRFFRSGTRTLG